MPEVSRAELAGEGGNVFLSDIADLAQGKELPYKWLKKE
jgi:hypothetical protein